MSAFCRNINLTQTLPGVLRYQCTVSAVKANNICDSYTWANKKMINIPDPLGLSTHIVIINCAAVYLFEMQKPAKCIIASDMVALQILYFPLYEPPENSHAPRKRNKDIRKVKCSDKAVYISITDDSESVQQ